MNAGNVLFVGSVILAGCAAYMALAVLFAKVLGV